MEFAAMENDRVPEIVARRRRHEVAAADSGDRSTAAPLANFDAANSALVLDQRQGAGPIGNCNAAFLRGVEQGLHDAFAGAPRLDGGAPRELDRAVRQLRMPIV
jgi:hypothetical protein